MASDHDHPPSRRKPGRSGFRPMATAATGSLRSAGARRGFAEHRLIALWEEVAGWELADFTTPLKVAFSRSGPGGTLVLATDGAHAVEAAHSSSRLIERVNAVYGYRAIDRVKIVQTGHGSSSESASPARRGRDARRGDLTRPEAVDAPMSPDISVIADSDLRSALARLEANIRNRAASRTAGRSRR